MTTTTSPETNGPSTGRAASSNEGLAAVGQQAAAIATRNNSVHVEIPGVMHIHLPPLDQLAFFGGVATLAFLQIIEWPVAAVLTVGHVLAHNRHNALLRDFGEALDEA
ncbi:MAG TPA: hypothetical protein VGP03_00860 [Pseudonocardiaceae bacterium]|nr:hypothetical protein [Pseudonocardiaceae bacterium]